MFEYTWIFHNNVNSRLGKKLIDWETAYNMYSNPGSMVCTRSCGDEGKVNDRDTARDNRRLGSKDSRDIRLPGMNVMNVMNSVPPSNQVTIRPLILYRK